MDTLDVEQRQDEAAETEGLAGLQLTLNDLADSVHTAHVDICHVQTIEQLITAITPLLRFTISINDMRAGGLSKINSFLSGTSRDLQTSLERPLDKFSYPGLQQP